MSRLHRTRSTTKEGQEALSLSKVRQLQAEQELYNHAVGSRRPATVEEDDDGELDYTSGDEDVDEFALQLAAAAAAADRQSSLVYQPHPVEVVETELAPLVAPPHPPKCRVLLMDVEFHQKGGRVCQWCVQSLDGQLFRNYWVHWRELHADWLWLVRERGVELDAWDDPERSQPLDQVFLRMLVNCCPIGTTTVLLFKGTIDIKRLLAHLDLLPGDVDTSPTKHAIARELAQRDVRYMQIERVWRPLVQHHLPAFLYSRLFHRKGATARSLEVIYDALFWHPVLVDVPRPGANQSEQVLDTRLGQPTGLRFQSVGSHESDYEVQWLRRGHHQPAFHTAHTDTRIMRDCTLFLLHYASNAAQLAREVQSHRIPPYLQGPTRSIPVDEFAFHLMATYVVRETDWLRTRHLEPSDLHLAWVGDVCLQSEHLKRLEWGDAPPPKHTLLTTGEDEEEEVVALPPPPLVLPPAPPIDKTRWTAPTMVKAREERHKSSGLVVQRRHGGEWTKVYVPEPTGRDAFRLRALQHAIHFDGRGEGTVYQRLEHERHSLDAAAKEIGTRPWFYYPSAVGKHAPGYLILHTRECSDRKNGKEYGEARGWSSDSVSYIDFDRLPHGLVGTKMRFCKECKVYADPSETKSNETKRNKSDVGELAAWLALLLD